MSDILKSVRPIYAWNLGEKGGEKGGILTAQPWGRTPSPSCLFSVWFYLIRWNHGSQEQRKRRTTSLIGRRKRIKGKFWKRMVSIRSTTIFTPSTIWLAWSFLPKTEYFYSSFVYFNTATLFSYGATKTKDGSREIQRQYKKSRSVDQWTGGFSSQWTSGCLYVLDWYLKPVIMLAARTNFPGTKCCSLFGSVFSK